MNSASQLEAIFFAALEKSSPAERAAYLDEACRGNAELRDRLERMVTAPSYAVDFLEHPAASFATTAHYETPISERPGAVIGPYKLLQQIGEGGMGVVFMAEQSRPVQRIVALKIIKPGMDSRQVIARFEAERQALALMDHPNIARVLDAGTTDAGRPYFVMELVRGAPITEYCDAHRLTPRERLELFASVCRAVHHAHQKGLIHRDVKPSNVLVAEYDSRPVPKVIDFGVAKAIGQRLGEQTVFTQYGQLVGTFEYMSPEQAKLNQLDVDTRSDIYSLGVVLYELLAGCTPFDRARLQSAAIDEILRIVREEEPQRPSARLSSSEALPAIAAHRHTDPARLNRLLRGELDWIVMKCLEKERNRRYETANGLAHDIDRYLNDEPVEASPPSAWYRVRKTVRRHRRTFAAVFAIASALIIGTLASLYFAFKARDRALEAQQNLATARVEKQRADNSAKHVAAEREEARDSLVRSLYNEARATLASGQAGKRWQTLDLLQRAEKLRGRQRAGFPPRSADASKLPSKADLRSEAVAALLTPDARLIREIQVSDFDNLFGRSLGGRSGSAIEMSADGTLAAAEWIPSAAMPARPQAAKEAVDPSLRCLHVVDVMSARELLRPAGNTDFRRLCFALSADGRQLAVAEPGLKVQIWAVPEFDRPQHALNWSNPPASDLDAPRHQLVFSPNGRRLAYIRQGRKQVDFAIWDLPTGESKTFRQQKDAGGPWGDSAFSSDSQHLLIRTGRNTMLLWNVDAGESQREVVLPAGFGAQLAFSPRDTLMAVALDSTSEVRGVLWDYAENRERAKIRSGFHLSALAFDHQGEFLAVGGEGGVMVYDASNLSEVLRIQGAIGGVSDLRWSPDGRRLIWRNMMGTLQVREMILTTPHHATPIEADSPSNLVFSPNGKWLGVGSREEVRVVDRTTGETRYELSPGGVLLFSPDSRQFAFIPRPATPTPISELETVISETETGKKVVSRSLDGRCLSAAFNQDGQLLVSLDVWHRTGPWSNPLLRALVPRGGSKKRFVLNVNANEVVWQQPPATNGSYYDLTLSPDGRLAASELHAPNAARPFAPPESQATLIWELPSGRKIAELETSGVATIFEFSPDHAFAVSLSWSVPDLNISADLTPSSNKVASVVWSLPDGRKRFTMGPWPDVRSPLRFAFSPDGRMLVAARRDGVVELWDVRRGMEILRVKLAGEAVNPVFTADSQSLAWIGSETVNGQQQGRLEYLDLLPLRRQLSQIGLDW